MHGNEWRRILALLANDRSRLVFAELVIAEAAANGLKLSETEKRKALTDLEKSKLVGRTDDVPEVNVSYVRALLEAPDGNQTRRGLNRFLVDGRIDRYPASLVQRNELLQWVSKQALEPGEVLDEPAFNDRLVRYADDVAVLRRYLVDAELVERTRSGTAYSLVRPEASN